MWKSIILDVECIVCNKSLQKINHDPQEAKRKMGKIACRRSRTPNWSVDEKKCLLELIKERKDVVINKNNNGPNYSEEKDVAWNEILRELSQRFGNKFTGSSIKKVKTQWQNMKRIAREEIALVGADLGKFTKQSLEVCNILDMVKDGVLKRDDEHLNDTIMTANVEIKTERLDEDMSYQPCSSGTTDPPESNMQEEDVQLLDTPATNNPVDLSVNSPAAETIEIENGDESLARLPVKTVQPKRDAIVMTESTSFEDLTSVSPFHRELKEFFRYSNVEKQLKMESLKEERSVVRAIRETAELNKIIAEQRLKHFLWLKKQEMT